MGSGGFGGDPPTQRSPFSQARDNMHSLRRHLAAMQPDFRRLLFTFAVCFPFARFKLSDPVEWNSWQVIDRSGLDRASIGECIRNALAGAAESALSATAARWFHPAHSLPSAATCARAAASLRPAFEFFESPASRRQLRDEELMHYTSEQFELLDSLATNDQVLLEGAAGTGKTLLAIEAARRGAATGASVLVCCFNRMLGQWITEELSATQATVGTLHQYMLGLAKLQIPNDPDPLFWEHDLPDAATEALLVAEDGAKFDLLIIDEAQDILKNPYLDVLDLSLNGGLNDGRWIMFGDFERQALYWNDSDASPLQVLHNRQLAPTRFRSTANCRNTPRIAALVTAVGGLTHGWTRVLRPDNGIEPEWLFYDTQQRQVSSLIAVLKLLTSEGYLHSEIVILSLRAHRSAAQSMARSQKERHTQPISADDHSSPRSATVHAFKGLEAPVVIVTDIDRLDRRGREALLYVAMTRATERLFLLAQERTKPALANLVLGEVEP